MKFSFTLNLPSKAGYPVQNVIGEVEGVNSVQELAETINNEQFIVVKEVYRNPEMGTHFEVGTLILNTNMIGKIKPYHVNP
jgi:hypothetical protein